MFFLKLSNNSLHTKWLLKNPVTCIDVLYSYFICYLDWNNYGLKLLKKDLNYYAIDLFILFIL